MVVSSRRGHHGAPPLDVSALSGIAFGSLQAFFAFIGFEDLANVVEEAKQPRRDIPRAMILTLLISTALYVLVTAVAVSTVSIERLALSPAPLSLVFRAVAEVQSEDDQPYRDCGDAEHDSGPDDHGVARALRTGP